MGCAASDPVYDPYNTNRPYQNPNQNLYNYGSGMTLQQHQEQQYLLQQQQLKYNIPQQQQQQNQLQQQQNAPKPTTYPSNPTQPSAPREPVAPIYPPIQTTQNNSVTSPKGNVQDPDVKLIEKFLEIQAKLDVYDKQGVFDGLRSFEDEVDKIKKNKQQAEVNCRVLSERTKKEKQDFDNITQSTVKGFFKDAGSLNRAISKEEAEYLQALNEEEIARNELKAVSSQFDEAKKKLDEFKKQNENAITLNVELSSILSNIFDGSYGSELENKLEIEVKGLTEEKSRVQTALQKWSNARFLLVYAYNQIVCAEARWNDLMGLDLRDKSKVILATEVRNNLVAANQNLSNSRSNLKGIDIPYCTDDDFKTLQGLALGVYNDMETAERQCYVKDILQTMRKRCAALCQWIDSVIKDSIVVEYVRTKADFDQKTKQLKVERIRIMQDKIKEKTGKEINIKIQDLQRDPTLIDLNPIPNQPLNIDGDNADKTKPTEISEKPVSIADLPPPPTRDQIMGNIELIKKRYFEQVDEFNRNVEENKREADEKIQKILAQYQPKVEN